MLVLVAQMIKHLPAMRESQAPYLGQRDPLEKEMATHSSTLAWKIPWMEEPGRLQSMWLHRVTHDYVINPHTHINISFVLYIYIFQILIPYKLL